VNPPAAEGMVTRLGELFRRALGERDTELVALEQELEYAENYLEIQRIRFAERLDYRIHVEPQLGNAQIPPLLLQPLLENAVEHGLRETEGSVHIELVCRMNGDRVEILIRNRSGGALLPARIGTARGGLGLNNVRDRLDAAYAGEGALAFRKVSPGEYESAVTFPRIAPRMAAAAS
jgi:LytS/YehU family sensor histidine kinase